ncbi:hypothetical protein BDY21DRAFT_337875 [Lineolata rhizophorae]|uniref:Uncharacterized protein n=1 Tax=Lineolata rhizophorae TaxID=578093 RepID=A0A6A6P637_9PEZI|nr:hypothetical protein BDY21DRAFT_337875 [Lineolata rhizophorae]
MSEVYSTNSVRDGQAAHGEIPVLSSVLAQNGVLETLETARPARELSPSNPCWWRPTLFAAACPADGNPYRPGHARAQHDRPTGQGRWGLKGLPRACACANHRACARRPQLPARTPVSTGAAGKESMYGAFACGLCMRSRHISAAGAYVCVL